MHVLSLDLDACVQVLYNLFEWPLREGSRLAVIGISNTHDLDSRVLPRIARWACMEYGDTAGRTGLRPHENSTPCVEGHRDAVLHGVAGWRVGHVGGVCGRDGGCEHPMRTVRWSCVLCWLVFAARVLPSVEPPAREVHAPLPCRTSCAVQPAVGLQAGVQPLQLRPAQGDPQPPPAGGRWPVGRAQVGVLWKWAGRGGTAAGPIAELRRTKATCCNTYDPNYNTERGKRC